MTDAGATVSVWFLRDGDGPPWPDAKVVDHLRTGRTAEIGRRLHLRRITAHAAGLRLRTWYARVRPDLVLLDDGVGGRVVPGSPRVVAVRQNTDPPDGPPEPRWQGPVDIVIVPEGRPVAPVDDMAAIVAEWDPEDPGASHHGSAFLTQAFGIDPRPPLAVVELPLHEVESTDLLAELNGTEREPIEVIVVDPTAGVGAEERLRSIPGAERAHLRPAVPETIRRAADLLVTNGEVRHLDGLLLAGVAVVGAIPPELLDMSTARWSDLRANPGRLLGPLLNSDRTRRRRRARERLSPVAVGPTLLKSIRRSDQ